MERELTFGERLRLTWRKFRRNDQVVLFLLAVLIGALGGVAAIIFRYAIDYLQLLFFGFRGEYLASQATSVYGWWIVILAPVLGGLAVGLFVKNFMPGQRPQGVADVIEAAALQSGRMSGKTGLKAAFVSALSIGSGASVGREGPVVHLCAAIGSLVARRFHLGRRLTRMLLGCGVAAGVAASFNAPIAGVFFALEVVIGHYALTAFAPIVIAGVTGTIISRAHFGDYPAFILPGDHQIASFWEFPAFAILGAVAALVAVIFIHSTRISGETFQKLPIPSYLRPALGGLAIGLIALVFPQVLGVGYEATDAALNEDYELWLLIALIAAKMAAVAISLGSGFGGGVFSPSLFIGAMLGGAYGIIAGSAFPDLASDHGAYTIVGMAAVAGAVLGAPISTIIIVFEMTDDYELALALMVATAIASIIVQQIGLPSFFSWQLRRRGVSIGSGRETGLLRDQKVRSLLDRDCMTLPSDADAEAVKKALIKAPHGELLVVDSSGELMGTITFTEMTSVAFDSSHDHDVEYDAIHLARKNPPLLMADDHLERAVSLFQSSGEPHIPVVDNQENRRFLGLVHEHVVMAAYHKTLMEARAEERGD